LGRKDDQVKVRGFRIELGEVEAALARHPGVRQAVVIARQDSRPEVRLMAYVVPNREQPATSDQLRDALRDDLPDYMIPALFVLLPKLPLTANGKIDRRNLPEPAEVQARVYVAPRNPAEEAISGIWAEVFRRERIGVEDNFFEIGGHSLMATQVISRVREKFRVTLDMRVLFEHPTVAGMAGAILDSQINVPELHEAEIVAVPRERYRRK
jgi:acyl carrier protein